MDVRRHGLQPVVAVKPDDFLGQIFELLNVLAQFGNFHEKRRTANRGGMFHFKTEQIEIFLAGFGVQIDTDKFVKPVHVEFDDPFPGLERIDAGALPGLSLTEFDD